MRELPGSATRRHTFLMHRRAAEALREAGATSAILRELHFTKWKEIAAALSMPAPTGRARLDIIEFVQAMEEGKNIEAPKTPRKPPLREKRRPE